MSYEAPEQREATSDEFKALAHPLRLRILRTCLHDSMTNKQISDRLGLDPATTLHHVRTLTRAGFLAAEPARNGKRGALEKPYRATNKSWVLAIPRADDRLAAVVASLNATRDEVVTAGPDGLITNFRLGLELSDLEVEELTKRLQETILEFAQRGPTPGGTRIGLSTIVHRLA